MRVAAVVFELNKYYDISVRLKETDSRSFVNCNIGVEYEINDN